MGQSESVVAPPHEENGNNLSSLLMCGQRRPEETKAFKASSPLEQHSSFGALAHADPVELVAAWVSAREQGDAKLATALCAEDLRFESGGEVAEYFEISGRDAIAEEIFSTPAPPFPQQDVLKSLHLVAKSDGGGRSATSAYIVAREVRLQRYKLRQEFTVINLKGWRNAMIILRIAVTRDLLRDEDIKVLERERPWAALATTL